MYEIEVVDNAAEDLTAIKDRRIRKQIEKQIDRLEHAPYKIGAPLVDDLKGYHRLKAAAGRYRVIYAIDGTAKKVYVVAVGIRKEGHKKDIYNRFRKVVRRGVVMIKDLLS